MPPIIKDLFLSKKFLVALFTAFGAFTAYNGWSVDPTTILLMAAPFLAYIGAQGWADSGKEKAKIDAAASIKIHAMTLQHASLTMQSASPIAELSPAQSLPDQKPIVNVIQINKETNP